MVSCFHEPPEMGKTLLAHALAASSHANSRKPLKNLGISCMLMGLLLPHAKDPLHEDTPVVWRGLIVHKAVQQLMFDVN